MTPAVTNTNGNGDVILRANVTANGGFSATGVNFEGASVAGGSVTINTGSAGNATITMTEDVLLGGMVVGGNLSVTAGANAGISE